jgi:magnesium transporter
VSLALQSLHAQAPTWSAALRKLRAEVLTGLLLGCASGLLVSLVSILWLRRPGLALCLLGGIGIGVAVAAVLGLAIPLLLRLVHREPHVAAGPVALAAADLVTLLLYFNLARWILA